MTANHHSGFRFPVACRRTESSDNSSFYKERFYATTLQISRSTLKTTHRELALLNTRGAIHQRFVIDDMNLPCAKRQRYSQISYSTASPAVGYDLKAWARDAIRRNAQGVGAAKIPQPGVFSTHEGLEMPVFSKGFDNIFSVKVEPSNRLSAEAANKQGLAK